MKNTKSITPCNSNYDSNTKIFTLKFKNCVTTISRRIRNSNKNQFIGNLKFFLNNRKNFNILLFFLFFSENYCSNYFLRYNSEQKKEILPYIFSEYNEYRNFEKKIWKNEDTTDEWKIENLKIIKSRLTGWQLESFEESYTYKIENGISLYKKKLKNE